MKVVLESTFLDTPKYLEKLLQSVASIKMQQTMLHKKHRQDGLYSTLTLRITRIGSSFLEVHEKKVEKFVR